MLDRRLRRLAVIGSLTAACLAPSVLLLGAAAVDEPATSETWFAGIANGKPFQSVHVTKTPQADGTLKLVRETRTLLNFLGASQDMQETFECVVDQSLAPRSCRFESRGASGVANATGAVEGTEFVVKIEREGVGFERRFALNERPIFSALLAEAVAARRDSGRVDQTIELLILNPGSWTLNKITATRIEDAQGLMRFKVTNDLGVGDQVLALNGQGAWEYSEFADLERRLKRVDGPPRLEPYTYSNRELLLFQSDRDIAFPERLRSQRVKLVWKNTPLDRLQLEDSRQHITRQQHDGERHEVELRLDRAAEISSPAPLPVEDASLTKYLGEDSYIRPHDPTIRSRALEWSADSKNTLEAVRRLSHEVSRYLQGGTLIAETLSGPEVLACRKGKCTEYTTLLASLCRAVGVPTRVALGMRLVNGQWVGHMWCETWVGQWIPVDASVDEVGGSPALLKLIDSETTMGTQRARWAMAKSLDLSTVDFERDPATATALVTGIVRQSYTNADFLCRISAPDAAWTLKDRSRPGAVTVQFIAPDKTERDEPFLHFVAFALPGKLDPAQLINGRKTQFTGMYKGFEELFNQPQSVGKLAGQKFVFRRDDGKSADKKYKTTEIIWVDDRAGYLLNLIAEESVHDAVLTQFEALLASFETLRQETPAGNAE